MHPTAPPLQERPPEESVKEMLRRISNMRWSDRRLGSMSHNELLIVIDYLWTQTGRQADMVSKLSRRLEEARRYLSPRHRKILGLEEQHD